MGLVIPFNQSQNLGALDKEAPDIGGFFNLKIKVNFNYDNTGAH
jgi:hypothetical protein